MIAEYVPDTETVAPFRRNEDEIAIAATLVLEHPKKLPHHVALLLDHADEAFSDPLAINIALAVRALLADGVPVEAHSVAGVLPLYGDATLADIIGLANSTVSPALLEFEAAKLWKHYTARRLRTELLTAAEALEKTGNPALVAKGVEGAIGVARSATNSLHHQLPSRLFQLADPPAEAPTIFSVMGIPICTPGNLSAITAPVKSGKTAWVNAMMAAAFRPGCKEIDAFGLSAAPNPDGRALIHLDTEQSPYDHWQSIARTLRRAKIEAPPKWLRSYWLAGYDGPKALAALRVIVEQAADACGGIYAIMIDGVADLVSDVNDPEECNALVAELFDIAIEHHCHIANAIHLNPQSETKSRGHLGSQLERKAETNLLLKKEGEVTGVFSSKQRRAPITEGTGPHFTWSHEHGMHMSCEPPAITAAKAKDEADRLAAQNEIEEVFRNRAGMPYKDVKASIIEALKVSSATAGRRINQWLDLGIITKNPGGIYAPST